MKGPAKSNRTGHATASDTVQTPPWLAKAVVAHFNPIGSILEPCRGTGNFYKALPTPKRWCEITEGRDFFDWDKKVQWILTNPPYSIYDKFLEHCFEVADNVVLLVPLQKAFKSAKNQHLVDQYGGLKEVVIIGGGESVGLRSAFLPDASIISATTGATLSAAG